jgi:tetratricopeptide (TPR) repeat protein
MSTRHRRHRHALRPFRFGLVPALLLIAGGLAAIAPSVAVGQVPGVRAQAGSPSQSRQPESHPRTQPPPTSAGRDILLFEADNALREGDFPAAVGALERILRNSPDDEEALEKLAQTWQRWGESGKADPDSLKGVTLDLYRRLLEENPRQPRALADVRRMAPDEWRRYMGRAASAESGGQDRIAETYLRIAFELSDTSVVLRERLGKLTRRLAEGAPEPERTFYMGRLELAEGRPFEAAARFRQCLDADSTMFAFRKYYGIALFRQDNPADGLTWLQPLAEQDPEDPDIRYYMGTLFYDMQHWQPALEQLLPVAEQRLYRGDAARMVGLALSRSGVHDEVALKYLLQAEDDGSTDKDLPCQVGEHYVRLGRWDEAGKSFERCRAGAPAHPAAHLGLGLVADEQGRWKESIDHFETFLTTNPKSPAVLIRTGVSWIRLDHPDSAAARFRSAIRADSVFASMPADSIGDVQACEVAFLVLMAGREYRDGIVVGEHLLKTEPDNPTYLNNLAMAFADAGQNLDRGLELAVAANEASPDNAGFQDTLGWVQVRRKDYDAAEKTFDRSLALAEKAGMTDVTEILYHRAVLHASRNDRRKAIDDLTKTLAGDPNPQVRRSAEALLRRLQAEQKKLD